MGTLFLLSTKTKKKRKRKKHRTYYVHFLKWNCSSQGLLGPRVWAGLFHSSWEPTSRGRLLLTQSLTEDREQEGVSGLPLNRRGQNSTQSLPGFWQAKSHLRRCICQQLSPPGSSVPGTFKQEYKSGLLCPPSGDLPDPGIKPTSLMSPELAGKFFTTKLPGNPICQQSDI